MYKMNFIQRCRILRERLPSSGSVHEIYSGNHSSGNFYCVNAYFIMQREMVYNDNDFSTMKGYQYNENINLSTMMVYNDNI